MSNGPLDDPRLREVEAALDDGRLEEAERLLAEFANARLHRQGTSYLTTRLLYQRQHLSVGEVAQRMRQVLHSINDFPQALALLNEAERGTLSPKSRFSTSTPQSGASPSTAIPGPPALPAFARTEPELPSPSSSAHGSDFALDPIFEPRGRSTMPAEFDTNFDQQRRRRARPMPRNTSLSGPSADTEESEAPSPSDEQHSEWPTTASYLERQANPRVSIRVQQPAEPHTRTDPVPTHAKAVATTDRVPAYGASVAVTDPALAAPAFTHGRTGMPGEEANSYDASAADARKLTIDHTPTMFSVLTLLDEHRYADALAALDASANKNTPELTLMRARALLGAGQRDEARDQLEQLCESSRLGPELRAGCARLFLEIGEPEVALEQADVALRIARDAPAVMLTAAWALVRVARRDQDDAKRDAARHLLTELESSGGSAPALASALWACIWSETGNPTQALKAAWRALKVDPDSVEALAGLATAHAALGEREQAALAWRKLLSINHDEASSLRPKLIQLGAQIERISPSLMPTTAEPASRRVWNPLEAALVSGEANALLEAWEHAAREIVEQLKLDASGLAELGRRSADALCMAPAFCHFAPFDLSLWSLFRLQVALDLVLPSIPPETDITNAKLLFAGYVGETVRLAYGGSWQGDLVSGGDAWVSARGSTLHPFLQVENRIERGVSLTLDDFVPLEFAHAAYAEWQSSMPSNAEPPTPWAPDAWPSLEDLGSIGRSLGRSVVGMYCERFAEQALDHTLRSLPALDSYLTLIAPPTGPRRPASPPLRRVAVLAGAYVGEVIKRQLGAQWQAGDRPGAGAYLLRLGQLSLQPVEQMLARLMGESRTTATEYVERAMRRPY